MLNDWIKNVIPIIVIIVVILLNYDLINRDVREGSLKQLITQSTSRWKYYISKFIAGMVMATFVIIFSLAISIIILNIKVKSEPMNFQ